MQSISSDVEFILNMDLDLLKREIMQDEEIKNQVLEKAAKIAAAIKDAHQTTDDATIFTTIKSTIKHMKTTKNSKEKDNGMVDLYRTYCQFNQSNHFCLIIEETIEGLAIDEFDGEIFLKLRVEFEGKQFVEMVLDPDGFPMEFQMDREGCDKAIAAFELEHLKKQIGFKYKEADFGVVLFYFVIKVTLLNQCQKFVKEPAAVMLLSGCCQMMMVYDKDQLKDEGELDQFWNDEELMDEEEDEMANKKFSKLSYFNTKNLKRKLKAANSDNM